jgi:hypothetical protein
MAFRACLVLGLLIIPSILPITWMKASLHAESRQQQTRINDLEERVASLEAAFVRNAVSSQTGLQKAVASPPVNEAIPAQGRAKTPKALPQRPPVRDPLVTRIQRRLALVETVIRWRRKAGEPFELAHHAAGMGVVHGVDGDLLVPKRVADPWSDRSMQSQREAAQRQGGRAQVLYRIWGSGLRVLGDGGKVNAANAMVFDRPLRLRPFGRGLVRLENVGFPGEENEQFNAPTREQTVLGFRWPRPLRAGLPEQTRPLQTDLAFGVASPSCAGCFIFGSQGQLVGYVDGIGEHLTLPEIISR